MGFAEAHLPAHAVGRRRARTSPHLGRLLLVLSIEELRGEPPPRRGQQTEVPVHRADIGFRRQRLSAVPGSRRTYVLAEAISGP